MPSLFRQLLKPVEMAEHDAPSMPQRERHDTPPDSKHETQQRAVRRACPPALHQQWPADAGCMRASASGRKGTWQLQRTEGGVAHAVAPEENILDAELSQQKLQAAAGVFAVGIHRGALLVL